MRKNIFYLLIFSLSLIVLFIIPEKNEEISDTEEIIKEEEVIQEKSELFISSESPEQGDTFFLKVVNEKGLSSVSGVFNSNKIDFIKISEQEWWAIIGIDAKMDPGNYNLSVNLPNKIEKEINVVKRDFPITELLVTKDLEEKGYSHEKIEENIIKKENVLLGEILNSYNSKAYFNEPFGYPLDKIKNVGNFGNIRKKGDISLQHLGVDLDTKEGTSVYAVNDGKICLSDNLDTYGKILVIDHGLGIYSLYLHLSEFNVLKGEKVKKGEIIGLSGNTGYSIAPHLHFSIKINGASVDPLRFINTLNKNNK